MATRVSDPVRYVANEWEDRCGYRSAVLSGIVPDERHKRNGGYHCSIEDLIAFGNRDDYSNLRRDDKGHNPKYGAAIDMSMSQADMVLCWKRLHAVWSDRSDPRRVYLNAINGWDGASTADRLDYVSQRRGTTTADHKWHVHLEIKRLYVLSWAAAYAIVSILKGEPKADYIAERTKPQEQRRSTGMQIFMKLAAPQGGKDTAETAKVYHTNMRSTRLMLEGTWPYIGEMIKRGAAILLDDFVTLEELLALGGPIEQPSAGPLPDKVTVTGELKIQP